MSLWLMLKGMFNPKWEEELAQDVGKALREAAERLAAVKVGDWVRYTGESVTKGSIYKVVEVTNEGVIVEITAQTAVGEILNRGFMIPSEKFERT